MVAKLSIPLSTVESGPMSQMPADVAKLADVYGKALITFQDAQYALREAERAITEHMLRANAVPYFRPNINAYLRDMTHGTMRVPSRR